MSYFVYFLGSTKKNKVKTYVGYTNNIKKRISLHNYGRGAKSTKGRKWILLYSKKYSSKKKAMKFEFYLKKNFKLRSFYRNKYIKSLTK